MPLPLHALLKRISSNRHPATDQTKTAPDGRGVVAGLPARSEPADAAPERRIAAEPAQEREGVGTGVAAKAEVRPERAQTVHRAR